MNSPISPDLASQIAIWRQKAVEGTLTVEETREALKAIRAGRESAAYASEASKRKTAKALIPSADDLLSELGSL